MAGPIQTPDDEPFEEFVRKAFVAELLMAEVYSTGAPVTLTGSLEEFDFSSMDGRWRITLLLASSNGRQVTTTEIYDYGSHFVGEVACRQTAHVLFAASGVESGAPPPSRKLQGVRQLLRLVLPDVRGAATVNRGGGPGDEAHPVGVDAG